MLATREMLTGVLLDFAEALRDAGGGEEGPCR
jgi:hypothetical protein